VLPSLLQIIAARPVDNIGSNWLAEYINEFLRLSLLFDLGNNYMGDLRYLKAAHLPVVLLGEMLAKYR
jgi:hypothetical protein